MRHNFLIGVIVILLAGVLPAGCSPGQSLESYGEQLVRASRPGPYTLAFIHAQKDLSPEILLGNFLKFIDQVWNYIPDPPGRDKATAAEAVFQSCSFKGDCEDLAVVIAAFCRGMGLECCFIFGQKKGHGHVWPGVKATHGETVDKELLKRFEKATGFKSKVIRGSNGCFLQLTPGKFVTGYRATHMITSTNKFIAF